MKEWFKDGQTEMGIDYDKDVAMYAASFVVRTGAKDEPYWHCDWEWFLGEAVRPSPSLSRGTVLW